MDDLVLWLTNIWDEDEAGWKAQVRAEAEGSRALLRIFGFPFADQMLARIAADRKILALHAPTPTTLEEVDGREIEPDSFEEIVGREVNCMACAGYPDAPCKTLLLLASAFTGRPGYQESWAVQ